MTSDGWRTKESEIGGANRVILPRIGCLRRFDAVNAQLVRYVFQRLNALLVWTVIVRHDDDWKRERKPAIFEARAHERNAEVDVAHANNCLFCLS